MEPNKETDKSQDLNSGESAPEPTESVTEPNNVPTTPERKETTNLTGSANINGKTDVAGSSRVTESQDIAGSSGVIESQSATGSSGEIESQGATGNSGVTDITDVTGSSAVTDNTDATGSSAVTECQDVAGSSGITESHDVTGGAGVIGSTIVTGNTGASENTLVEGSEGVSESTAESTSVAESANITETTVTAESTAGKTETSITTWTFDESEFSDVSELDDFEKRMNETAFDIEWNSRCFLLPAYILSLHEERHIRAEDPDWALRPVPDLEETIIRASKFRKGPELISLLKHLDANQREIVINLLPLDIPLKYTLPLNDFETYWKRKCTDKWQHCPVWRYNDEWKTLFVERTVQESIENFVPGESDLFEFKTTLDTFKNYVTRLKISRLGQRKIEPLVVDVTDEDFDVILDNFLGVPDSTSVFLDIETVLGTLAQLKEFFFVLTPSSLDSNSCSFRLSTKDFNSLFRGLKKCCRLQKLRFSNGILQLRQKQLVLNSLCRHDHLQVLNLSYDAVDDALCDHIGKLLLSPCPLKALVLKDNKITDEGAEVLASALSVNGKLELLDLTSNWIQDNGGIVLAKVLATNAVLKSVDLTENKLTAPAGEAFADALCRSTSIRCFRISKNNLGEDVGPHFSRSVVENKGILTLEVKDCLFSPIDEKLIHKTVLENRSCVPFDMYD